MDIKPVPTVFNRQASCGLPHGGGAVCWCMRELHLLPGFVSSSRDVIGCGFRGELRPAGGIFFISWWLLPCEVKGE